MNGYLRRKILRYNGTTQSNHRKDKEQKQAVPNDPSVSLLDSRVNHIGNDHRNKEFKKTFQTLK